jgi:hypothetical protein
MEVMPRYERDVTAGTLVTVAGLLVRPDEQGRT